METLECIRRRADIRSYKPDMLPDELVKSIIEAAVQAPSSGNLQNWEFIIIRKHETKKALAAAAFGQPHVEKAPLVIVVCANLSLVGKYGVRGRELYSIQNAAVAAENLMLAAWDKGIATCWVGAFNDAEARRILNLPEAIRPLAIITAGYPAELVKKPARRPASEVMHMELYGGKA